MSKVLVNESSLSGIANAIREKNGSTAQYKPSEMAAAISAITAGGGADLPEDALTISGNCDYRFRGWDWFLREHGHKLTANNITTANYMFEKTDVDFTDNMLAWIQGQIGKGTFEYLFKDSTTKYIPSLTFDNAKANHARYMFQDCSNVEQIGDIVNLNSARISGTFSGCKRLRYLPELINFNSTALEASGGRLGYMFSNCYSLRKIPKCWLSLKSGSTGYYSMYGGSPFQNCYVLDEINGLSVNEKITLSTNEFNSPFSNNYRLKDLTFETNDDGTPKVVNWKGQTIELSYYNIGYGREYSKSDILDYNSGITADKKVNDDATYAALKEDPDWFTYDVAYSRYNHDSAVNTINSLPDTSAYIATAGGTNTIKFNGASGSKTDGGAISALTEAEIAVAAAKGWTVSLS